MKKFFLLITSFFVFAMGSAFSASSNASNAIKSPVFVRTTIQSNIETKRLKFNVDGESVSGTLTIPKNGKDFPLVIIDSQKEEDMDGMESTFSLLASKLIKEDIASFKFDPLENDVDLSSAIQIVTDYLASLDKIDKDRIGLFGWAQGAEDVKNVIADESDIYSSILTWSKKTDNEITITRVSTMPNRFRRYFRHRRFPFGPNRVVVKYGDGRALHFDTAFSGPRVYYSSRNLTEDNADVSYFKTEVSISNNSPSVYKIYTNDLSQIKDNLDETVDWFSQTL